MVSAEAVMLIQSFLQLLFVECYVGPLAQVLEMRAMNKTYRHFSQSLRSDGGNRTVSKYLVCQIKHAMEKKQAEKKQRKVL